MTEAALATAADDGDDRRRPAVGDGDPLAADRAGVRGDIAVGASEKLFDAVYARFKAGDDQRLVELQTAACAQLEDLAAGVAGAGDADAERARRAGRIAAGLQHDLVDDQRGAAGDAGVRILRGIAVDGLNILAAGRAILGVRLRAAVRVICPRERTAVDITGVMGMSSMTGIAV